MQAKKMEDEVLLKWQKKKLFLYFSQLSSRECFRHNRQSIALAFHILRCSQLSLFPGSTESQSNKYTVRDSGSTPAPHPGVTDSFCVKFLTRAPQTCSKLSKQRKYPGSFSLMDSYIFQVAWTLNKSLWIQKHLNECNNHESPLLNVIFISFPFLISPAPQ